jgi:hypothetical protein
MAVLSVFDLRFLLSRSKSEWLPEELDGVLALGPTGIRNVQGIGNNTQNPAGLGFFFGSADTPFKRLTIISGPFANSTRGPASTVLIGNVIRVNGSGVALPPTDTTGGTVRDALNMRIISNLISDVSNPIGFQALDPNDPYYEAKQELLEQDNPTGRIGPADGGINPLAFSNWLPQFGQFFSHGLDFVQKGADGQVKIELLPSDSLYDRASPTDKSISGSRSNTINVTIGVGSTDTLLEKMGIILDAAQADNSVDIVSWAPLSSLTTPVQEQ